MTRDFDHDEGFIQPCLDCEKSQIASDLWKGIAEQFFYQHRPCDCVGCLLYERALKNE